MDAPLWSILIPTLISREDKFLALLNRLLPQTDQVAFPVEVVALQNFGQKSLAAYRQQLLQDARGMYISFIDDDDEVAGDFVLAIGSALAQQPDVVGFKQLCTGLDAQLTVITLRHGDWHAGAAPVPTADGLAYFRTYSHVCPLRAEVAKQASFLANGALRTGEDWAFVQQVVPLLHERGDREVFIDRVLYHYRWSAADSTQRDMAAMPTGLAVRAMQHQPPAVRHHRFRWLS